jgi:Fe-S-cluster-containing hydrogenase component 2
MIACPLGGVVVNREEGHVVKCDLCGGDPICVKFCGYGAIEYITEELAAWRKKKEAVRGLAGVLEILTFHSEQ